MNNKIILVGRVVKNPVAKPQKDSTNQVVKFSLAVKEFTANSEEKKTLYFDFDAWNGLGERILNQVVAGQELVVEGRISYSDYIQDRDGIEVQIRKHFIKLSTFTLVGDSPEKNPPEEEEAAA